MNNIANMENQRLREAPPVRELDDDEILQAVLLLMNRVPRYKAAMAEMVNDFLIAKGELVAINLNLPFPPEVE